MAITVNRVPLNTVPPEWAFHPTIGPFIRDLLTIVWQGRERMGGDVDHIDNQQKRELFPWNPGDSKESSANRSLFEAHHAAQLLGQFSTTAANSLPQFSVGTARQDFFSVSSSHTTAGNEIVEVTEAITVTLNSAPDSEERVTIKRNTTSGSVTIDGNGKTIDGESTFVMYNNFECINVMYSADSGGWLII